MPDLQPSPWRPLLKACGAAIVALIMLGAVISWDAGGGNVTSGSSALAPGTVIATLDTPDQGRDYTLEFPAGTRETDIFIWDYGAEDGDWVQVRVNGTPLGEPFMILHAAKQLRVPVGGTLEVVGVRDGYGGITYAVHFQADNTTIRNGIPVGAVNRYTLNVGQSGGARP